MIEKYGSPQERTNSALFWFDRGPWKRIAVIRDPQQHHFPRTHYDVLEQTVKFRVPPEKFDDLARFDGSVWGIRTKGELCAGCNREAMNVLSLNMAYDIICDAKTVDEAREEFGKQAMAFMMGMEGRAPDTARLKFEPQKDSPDPGESIVGETIESSIKEGVQKIRERIQRKF
jgi:hypothetical protein